jgi:tetratricopeptide (TPR) repeat protein
MFGLGCALGLGPALGQAKKGPAAAPPAHELALQGKVSAAVTAAQKTPGGGSATVKALADAADARMADRKLQEARAALEAAQKFTDEYARKNPKDAISRDPLQARKLRLDGIELSDKKDYAKAESTLRSALEIAQRVKDPTLEAAVRNNLGHALRNQQKDRDAIKEFVAARTAAESQQDNARAGSYNFNLGLALFQAKSFEQAFDAFKRSADQNEAVKNPSVQARALLWQGRSLSAVNSASAEPIKYFDRAQKLFHSLGDDAMSGWCFYYMGDHIAYSFNFKQAAKFGESAIPPFTRANARDGLAVTYEFLADMFARLQENQKSEGYKKKALEMRAPEGK